MLLAEDTVTAAWLLPMLLRNEVYVLAVLSALAFELPIDSAVPEGWFAVEEARV